MEITGDLKQKKHRPASFARLAAGLAILMILLLGSGPGQALAGQVTLNWNPNTELDLAGYKLYYGMASRIYGTPIDVGNVTTYTITGLVDGQSYLFAATAYDTLGNESGYSNEVSRVSAVSAIEINLVGNSTAIAAGDMTPSAADFTDFGSASVTGGSVTRTFTIQNQGAGTLSLTGSPLVAISGTNAADFTVIVLPVSPVAENGNTTFQVRFAPSAAGTRSATLSIANNDADENPYNFSIKGTGTTATTVTVPEINVLGNAVSIVDGDTTPLATDFTDFGGTRLAGGTVTRIFTIQNTGTGALALSGTPPVTVSGANTADFTVTVQPAASVVAAGSTTFQVRFDPNVSGRRIATLTIANSDANENPYNFTIQGRGVAPPAAPSNVHTAP